jgi:hypothetical protein
VLLPSSQLLFIREASTGSQLFIFSQLWIMFSAAPLSGSRPCYLAAMERLLAKKGKTQNISARFSLMPDWVARFVWMLKANRSTAAAGAGAVGPKAAARGTLVWI